MNRKKKRLLLLRPFPFMAFAHGISECFFRNKGTKIDMVIIHCPLRIFLYFLQYFFFFSSLIFCGLPLLALLIPLVRPEFLFTELWRVFKEIVFPFTFSCFCIWGYILPAVRAATILLRKEGDSSHFAGRTLPAGWGPWGRCGVLWWIWNALRHFVVEEYEQRHFEMDKLLVLRYFKSKLT